MAQTVWDPLRELVGIQERMNKLIESALARTNFGSEGGIGAWTPIADVFEEPERIVFCLELPGLAEAEIDVRLDGDELVVQGERRMERGAPGEQFHRVERSYGKFARRFRLPTLVDSQAVDATYALGVLTISLTRKADAGKKPIRVAIR